ncbi:hypothetical protein [Streptomyces alkaliphilus]|uniref:hypothetical protein n=1 Tax=Streptomyces alkaliphilus TaxID=1472722 RepID=UPI0011801284|nr:hypothetical protein [Streptomyces alkaliphilus]MQS05754.1 hypothetical protein [Streptomyces alkaliphilus]
MAVVATPFGFGPASKAYSIGRVLAEEHDMDVRYHGSGSALDFFAAQPDTISSPLDTTSPPVDPSIPGSADAVINVLAPEMIPSAEIAASTYYVDSLGFMWERADVPEDSPLTRVRAYFAQDLFGSVANLSRLGLRRVIPVSGIVAPVPLPGAPVPGTPDRTRALVQLGGLGNPAGPESGRVYLALAERLLIALGKNSYELEIAMNRSDDGFRLEVDAPVRHLSAEGFRIALGGCDVVLSSPGMTTLVEVSQSRRPYVPLPPQNWSQVVICRHMTRRSGHGIWTFLTRPYDSIDARGPEEEKAAAVREVNRQLASDTGFIRGFAEIAHEAVSDPEVPEVGNPFEGAREIAATVARDLNVGKSPVGPRGKEGKR